MNDDEKARIRAGLLLMNKAMRKNLEDLNALLKSMNNTSMTKPDHYCYDCRHYHRGQPDYCRLRSDRAKRYLCVNNDKNDCTAKVTGDEHFNLVKA